MAAVPSFAAFYETLYDGRAPFPWQVRLAEEVLDRGWPELLDLPTGAGKTSALDVAVYCLSRSPESMPRRTLLVVDRRIVVDQGAVHARNLLECLRRATGGPVAWVASALRQLWGAERDDAPFAVAVMRGGMPRDNDWARRPDQPVLGVSTVDQVGSRLLFRGYGVAPRSASIHAGLLGNDTLILLDEVHLSVPFAQTLHAIGNRYRKKVNGLPDRFSVVQMSATPGTSAAMSRRFALEAADRAHPVLGKRVAASKAARLVPVKVTGSDEAKRCVALAQHAVNAAIELQAQGASVVGLVVNRVDTARQAYAHFQQRREVTDAILVTGRMRPIDRDAVVRASLLPRAGAGRDRTDTRPLVVVATQCIEAGADLDFDGLVTECASFDALRQRFGRVDRRGELGRSTSLILGRTDQIAEGAEDAVYGAALSATWRWLEQVQQDGALDLGIAALVPSSIPANILAPHVDAPVMLHAHLDAWAQTSPRPATDPEVGLWLHGPQRASADVQLIWRVRAAASKENFPGLLDHLIACRPSTLEAVTVPLGAARRWLAGQEAPPIADVVIADAAEPERVAQRRDASDDTLVALRWNGDDSELITANELRPGDVLVIDVSRGGLTARSFDPDATEAVTDLGDLAQLRGRGLATLRLQRDALRVWQLSEAILATIPPVDSEETSAELRERVLGWLRTFPSEPPAGFIGTEREWSAAHRAWRSSRMRVEIVNDEVFVVAPVSRADLHADPEAADALTEDDDSSFRQTEVTLATHSTDVRDVARRFGRAIGLAEPIAEDLALAAWFHDVGKADPRFQRWLVGGSDIRAAMLTEPLAKSALPAGNAKQRRFARTRAGYPSGYRHELLSLAMIEHHPEALSQAHDRDLVLHLVASHHGWCRPFAPSLDHPDDLPVAVEHGMLELAATTRHRLSRLDSGTADRFWSLTERYGWWGLAWLEAVLRLADHRASEMETEVTP